MLKKYSDFISKLPYKADNAAPMTELLLWRDEVRKLDCFYAPFDYINTEAKIILVGITPGKTQMNRALNAARMAIQRGDDLSDTIRRVKREGSFSGKMRSNIVDTLNRLGYQKLLGIECSSKLWSTDDHLVHFCSMLKYPIFKNGGNYSGDPKALGVPELEKLIYAEFVKDLQNINHSAVLVPLGDKVGEVISKLDEQGLIPQKIKKFEGKIVAPPHPSPANNESVDLLRVRNYPSKEEYQEKKYQNYLLEKNEKGEKPQSESSYKKTRGARWENMLFVRRAYEIR